MFADPIVLLAVVVLAMLSAGGVAWALVYPRLSGDDKAEKRFEAISERATAIVEKKSLSDVVARRKNIQETLKELDKKQKAKNKETVAPPLSLRLQQAGLTWSKQKYFIFSAVCGVVFFVIGMMVASQIYVWAAFAFIGVVGFPRFFVDFLRKRRMKRFLEELPNAVDVIVRGVKSGLPLGDCLRIIATEGQEPLKTEFKAILETQAAGIPLGEACLKLYERMPVQEANFFGIVISIQQRAGGNLSESLGNLSKVLRDRKKMKAKIIAMSQEAKASAMIIGSLPGIMMTLVYLTTPSYIALLFTTQAGNVILAAGVTWMLMGVLVMKKMINFDF